MSNVSAVTKYFPTANEGFTTTLNGSILSGATTVPLTSVSGLTNGTVFVGIIEPGATKQQVFTGTVDTAGVQITGVVWTRGSNVAHSTGVTIVDYVTGTALNMISAGVSKEHSSAGAHNATAAATLAPLVGALMHPIGSIYINASDSTNPATLLGFGTWTAFGAGRVPVGKNTTGTFQTAGATGGEETHILTTAEMPSHTHSLSFGAYIQNNKNYTGTGFNPISNDVSGGALTIGSAGGDGAHNNLQPYIVVYMWKRTA